MTSTSTYYYTNAMTNLFVNTASSSGVSFLSIGSMADFWTVSFPLYLLYYQSKILLCAVQTELTASLF